MPGLHGPLHRSPVVITFVVVGFNFMPKSNGHPTGMYYTSVFGLGFLDSETPLGPGDYRSVGEADFDQNIWWLAS